MLALIALAAGTFAVMSLTGRLARPLSESDLLVADATSGRPVDATGESRPNFARLGGQNLVLPVAARDATIIAYHPTADERSVAIEPLGDQVNGGVVSRSFERVFSSPAPVHFYVLSGDGRAVTQTGAVDVGAAPGTVITSPVNGEVVGVKHYKLLGKYDDVQIDIRPAKASGLTVSILFVEDAAVTIGETVVAGSTQLGKVRKPQGDLGARLAEYTRDSGGHVHIEVYKDATD